MSWLSKLCAVNLDAIRRSSRCLERLVPRNQVRVGRAKFHLGLGPCAKVRRGTRKSLRTRRSASLPNAMVGPSFTLALASRRGTRKSLRTRRSASLPNAMVGPSFSLALASRRGTQWYAKEFQDATKRVATERHGRAKFHLGLGLAKRYQRYAKEFEDAAQRVPAE